MLRSHIAVGHSRKYHLSQMGVELLKMELQTHYVFWNMEGELMSKCVNQLEVSPRARERAIAWIEGMQKAIFNRSSILGTRVKCLETGEEFISIAEAARVLSLDAANISRVVDLPHRRAGGFHFVRV